MKELIEELRYLAGVIGDADGAMLCQAADAIESQAATIASYETTAENYELLQAKVAEQAREIERLNREAKNDAIAYRAVIDRQDELRAELTALKAQSGGVVMPERVPYETPGSEYFHGYNAGWASGLDAVARLNSSPVSAGDGMRNADNPAARCICREEFGHRVCAPSAGGVDERAEVVGYLVSMPGEPNLGTWLDENAEDEPQIQHHEALMRVSQHEIIISALKSKMLSPVVADERKAFDAYFCAEQGFPLDTDTTHIGASFAPWRAWQARAALTASAPNHSEQAREECRHEFSDDGEFTVHCSKCDLTINAEPPRHVLDSAAQQAFEAGGTEDGGYVLTGHDLDQIVAQACAEAVIEFAAAPSAGSQGGDV